MKNISHKHTYKQNRTDLDNKDCFTQKNNSKFKAKKMRIGGEEKGKKNIGRVFTSTALQSYE